MLSIIFLLIVFWVIPKIFPYWGIRVQAILLIFVTLFSFIENDGLAIIIILISDIAYGYQLIKYGLEKLGSYNLKRHIEKQNRKK